MGQPKNLSVKVGVGALSSPLEVGASRAPEAANQLEGILRTLGCQVVQAGAIGTADQAMAAGRKFIEHHVHAIACVSVSWYEDYLAMDLLEECSVPILLWSLPGMETGALCGNQQLTAVLQQLGNLYTALYGPLEDLKLQERALPFLRAAALHKELRTARIGLAGHPAAGMMEAACNEIDLKKTVGPRVIHLDLPGLLERVKTIPDSDAQPLWQDLLSRSAACTVPAADGVDSMKVYLALKEPIQTFSLDALTVGCYPHLMGRVCLAASLLADEGIPLGCEGDVNGAAGQLLLQKLTGFPTHNTDWLDPLEDESVVFTHCGSGSFRLAEHPERIRLSPVRLMNQGACALFTAKPGPVTLLNLIPSAGGYQLALLEGEAVSTEMVFPGNPLRVKFDLPLSQLLDWIHQNGVGHHWMAGYGHAAEELRWWAQMAGASLSLLEP